MHDIEPFFDWRHLYKSEEDGRSPFYQRVYNEFFFENAVYNYLIHPQWDSFGSSTLYTKILYVNYRKRFLVAECIGEWNDALYDDFLNFWGNVLGAFYQEGINYFIVVAESIFNFHQGNKNEYEALSSLWKGTGGWVSFVNTSSITMRECEEVGMKKYFQFITIENWRSIMPDKINLAVELQIKKL